MASGYTRVDRYTSCDYPSSTAKIPKAGKTKTVKKSTGHVSFTGNGADSKKPKGY